MGQVVYILFGALLTVAAAFACGRLALAGVRTPLYKQERVFFAFVTGSALLSMFVFVLAAAGLARKGVFLTAGLAVVGFAIYRGLHRIEGESFAPLPRPAKWIFAAAFVVYSALYLSNAMAPEISPDGTTYHLGLVARYYRDHGFTRITNNMYAALSQGMEMLFLFAFSIGRHSAADMVHYAFLTAMPFGILSFGRRFGFAGAGVAAAILFFCSPVVGIDGTSAYNDVATACILFSVFYLLQIWDQSREQRLLIAVGVLAGFAFGVKYTAFLAVPYALGFVLWRARKLQPLVIVFACALPLIVPWMIKNAIVMNNPVAPFFNRIFPNPYIHVQFEQEYIQMMSHFMDVPYSHLPLETTVKGGALGGLIGPIFLLAPLALLSLRTALGRRVFFAFLFFGAAYFGNTGTRFLIPSLPFLSLAMALALPNLPAVGLALAVVHAVISWPTAVPRYADPHAWRLDRVVWKIALRMRPEENYLKDHIPAYLITRAIEDLVPKGEKVLAFTDIPYAYTSREVITAYQSALGENMNDWLYCAMIQERGPIGRQRFKFKSQKLRKVRVVQTAPANIDLWSIAEFRVLRDDRELPRADTWRLRAKPNPWEVQMAFDNSPITRWRSYESMKPGMFMEVDFGREEEVDEVLLESSRDQYKIRMRLEDGNGRVLVEEPEDFEIPMPLGLRRAAIDEIRLRGYEYMVVWPSDFGAQEYRRHQEIWGIKEIAERNSLRLYQLKGSSK
jgi:hypothetical protein